MTTIHSPSKMPETHSEKQIGEALATLQDALIHAQIYSKDLHAAAGQRSEMADLQDDMKGLRDTLGAAHEQLRDMRDTFIGTAALHSPPSPIRASDLDANVTHTPSPKNMNTQKLSTALDDPLAILNKTIKQLGDISGTFKQLSGYAGQIPKELKNTVPTIAKSALSCSTQLGKRLSTVSDSLNKIKIDPNNFDGIQSVSTKAKAIGKAAKTIAQKDLSKQLMAQCQTLYGELTGDGAQLKKDLLPTMTKIKHSITSLSQESGIPLPPQLALALDTYKVVLNHIPDQVLDTLAAIFPLDRLKELSQNLDALTPSAPASAMASRFSPNPVENDHEKNDRSQKSKQGHHKKRTLKYSVQSQSALFGSALTCAALEDIFSTLQATVPLSVYVEFGPKLAAELGVRVGWAAGFIAMLGTGVAGEIGLASGLTIVNLMAVLCGLNIIILGITRITLESIFVLSEL